MLWLTVNEVFTGPVVMMQLAVQVGSGVEIEGVLAGAGEGAGNQEDGRGIVDDADSSGEFGVAGVVEDVGSGEAGREDWVTDDCVPVETNAGLDEKAIGEAPTIFRVGADLGVVLLVHRCGTEGGVAGAGETGVWRGVEAGDAWGQRGLRGGKKETDWRPKVAS